MRSRFLCRLAGSIELLAQRRDEALRLRLGFGGVDVDPDRIANVGSLHSPVHGERGDPLRQRAAARPVGRVERSDQSGSDREKARV